MSNTYEQFGKYLLLEKVAAGGMAEIYLAKSSAANGLNKFVAIKRILPQFSNNEDFVAMFKEEAKVCINLNHSNVVSIFDFGVEAGQFFLVMDYVEGRNLRQIINELKKVNKSFTIDQALYLVKEAAAGLDHAHRCVDSTSGKPLNITHRDMSPQNIMVSFEGEIRVIDFGIAKAETEAESTKAGTLKGKFSYMSPEQAEGQPIDPRTDVFVLGIVLWELLANDRLFTGSNEAAILRKVRDCQVPPIRKINPTVPQELERIVMKALAKDRNVRYQTAANFHRDLNRFLNTQYPDFSPQDFSAFIKDAFKASYQEGREKLITYANVAMPEFRTSPLVPRVNTAITQTNIPVALSTPPVKQMNANSSEKNSERKPESSPHQQNEHQPPPTGFNADKQVKVNLEDLRSVASNPIAPSKTSASNPRNPNQTRITQVSQVSYGKKKKSGESTDVIFKFVILLVLVFGGWWGYKNVYLPQEKKANANLIKNKDDGKRATAEYSDSTTNAGVQEISSVTGTKVSISSNVQKAMIFVDGIDTKFVTPGVITVPSNKPVKIELKAEGYEDYPIEKQFTGKAETITATLQKKSLSAFLNISLHEKSGPNSDSSFTKIKINGTELLEKPPILKYPVSAEKEVIITAYNPITKKSDEKRVMVKPGETLEVTLDLEKQKTK